MSSHKMQSGWTDYASYALSYLSPTNRKLLEYMSKKFILGPSPMKYFYLSFILFIAYMQAVTRQAKLFSFSALEEFCSIKTPKFCGNRPIELFFWFHTFSESTEAQ